MLDDVSALNGSGALMEIDVEEYYKKYGPLVLRRCRFILKDEDLAYDAMQDVFVNLLKNANRLKGDYPSSLLYKIATNVCLNMIRSRKKESVNSGADILDTIASYDDSEDRIFAEDLLDKIFSREKATTREIAVMHYVDNMTLEETAREAGLSVSGVRKRLRLLKEKAQIFRESSL
jgi:RNA polymerase sigma-70 factor (ECF subfamily)